MPAAAALALTAGLFHVFNHSIFKSLLFFGAGAVLNATGERDMEHLGGLIHRMPQTAFVFLVGCVAISALPPLNGFVSEWMTFQAILLSPQLPSWGFEISGACGGCVAGTVGGACRCLFCESLRRELPGAPAHTGCGECARDRQQFTRCDVLSSALCLVAGILPGIFIDALAPVTNALVGVSMPHQTGLDWLTIVPIAESRSSYNGLLVFVFVTLSGSISAFAIHRLASDKLRRGPAWDCGYPDLSAVTQYTASSFAQPIRRVYGTAVFHAREIGEMPPPGSTRPARLTVELRDLIWDAAYEPIATFIGYAADRLNVLQFLTIRRYLTLVFSVWCCSCWCSQYGNDPRLRLPRRADAASAGAVATTDRLRT